MVLFILPIVLRYIGIYNKEFTSHLKILCRAAEWNFDKDNKGDIDEVNTKVSPTTWIRRV